MKSERRMLKLPLIRLPRRQKIRNIMERKRNNLITTKISDSMQTQNSKFIILKRLYLIILSLLLVFYTVFTTKSYQISFIPCKVVVVDLFFSTFHLLFRRHTVIVTLPSLYLQAQNTFHYLIMFISNFFHHVHHSRFSTLSISTVLHLLKNIILFSLYPVV